MGCIISKIEDIDRLRWTQLRKGRVVKASRVVMVDEVQAIIELTNGDYTVVGRRHTPNGKWAMLGYGFDRFEKSVLDGLVRMGIVTRQQVDEHLGSLARSRDRQRRKDALDDLKQACETLGIEVPDVPGAANETA